MGKVGTGCRGALQESREVGKAVAFEGPQEAMAGTRGRWSRMGSLLVVDRTKRASSRL